MQTALTTQSYSLADGDSGTAFTIAKMNDQIDQGKKSAQVRAAALSILNQYRVRAFDWMGQARAIYDWVLKHITFTPDTVGKEAVQTAEWTLLYRRGDCDCISVLMCALLESVGLRCRLMTIASDPRDKTVFTHVYPQVLISGNWVCVDAARRSPAFGKCPQRYFRKRAWSTDSDEYEDMSGLGIPMPMATPAPPRAAGVPPQYYSAPPARRTGRKRLRGLGQSTDDINWSGISQAITAGTVGASDIIAASRANPYNLVPTTAVGAAPGSPNYSAMLGSGTIFGMSTSTLLLLALLVGGVMYMRNQ
jgi:hypothetical protein